MSKKGMINIAGASDSRLAPIISHLLKDRNGQSLIVVPSVIRARHLAVDLSFFTERKIYVLPEEEDSFMQYEAANNDSLLERLSILKAAVSGEREEWEILYKNSAQVAKEDGFDDISRLFSNILEIEKRHAHRFELLAEELKAEILFKKEETTQWVCRKCGHIHIGKEAPCKCPVCEHPQGYFQVFIEKF